jgi:hypothetical protein
MYHIDFTELMEDEFSGCPTFREMGTTLQITLGPNQVYEIRNFCTPHALRETDENTSTGCIYSITINAEWLPSMEQFHRQVTRKRFLSFHHKVLSSDGARALLEAREFFHGPHVHIIDIHESVEVDLSPLFMFELRDCLHTILIGNMTRCFRNYTNKDNYEHVSGRAASVITMFDTSWVSGDTKRIHPTTVIHLSSITGREVRLYDYNQTTGLVLGGYEICAHRHDPSRIDIAIAGEINPHTRGMLAHLSRFKIATFTLRRSCDWTHPELFSIVTNQILPRAGKIVLPLNVSTLPGPEVKRHAARLWLDRVTRMQKGLASFNDSTFAVFHPANGKPPQGQVAMRSYSSQAVPVPSAQNADDPETLRLASMWARAESEASRIFRDQFFLGLEPLMNDHPDVYMGGLIMEPMQERYSAYAYHEMFVRKLTEAARLVLDKFWAGFGSKVFEQYERKIIQRYVREGVPRDRVIDCVYELAGRRRIPIRHSKDKDPLLLIMRRGPNEEVDGVDGFDTTQATWSPEPYGGLNLPDGKMYTSAQSNFNAVQTIYQRSESAMQNSEGGLFRVDKYRGMLRDSFTAPEYALGRFVEVAFGLDDASNVLERKKHTLQ